MSSPALSGAQPALRIGVIGTGRIGRLHAELLATRQVPGATLAAVSDVAAGVAEEVGVALGVPWLETGRVLADAEIDAVAICSSTDTHADLIVEAAEAGKAIFCEKPISLDLAEVDRALAAVERCGAPMMVGFNRRFDPSHSGVRRAVTSDDTGAPQLVRITSRDPEPPPISYARSSGGIFLDMAIHDFDMARYLVASEVVDVYATGEVLVEPQLAELGDVDTAVTILRHESGCLTVIDNSRRSPYGYDQRVEVLGPTGLAASENPPADTTVVRSAGGTRLANGPYFFLERYLTSYIREWQAFVGAIASRTEPPVSGVDGRAALLIGLAAKRSLSEHRPVRVAEVDHEPPAATSGHGRTRPTTAATRRSGGR